MILRPKHRKEHSNDLFQNVEGACFVVVDESGIAATAFDDVHALMTPIYESRSVPTACVIVARSAKGVHLHTALNLLSVYHLIWAER